MLQNAFSFYWIEMFRVGTLLRYLDLEVWVEVGGGCISLASPLKTTPMQRPSRLLKDEWLRTRWTTRALMGNELKLSRAKGAFVSHHHID